MYYAISRNVLYSEKDLICTSAGYSWVEQIPANIMTYDSDYLLQNCIRTSLRLIGKAADDKSIIEPYIRAMGSLPSEEKSILSSFIPKQTYKAYTTSIIKKIEDHLTNPSYYDRYFKLHDKIFDSLECALADISKISEHSAKDASNRPVLASFYPSADGKCRGVKYDRLSGRTGRLKVASGPSILTLKKEYRDILRSRFEGGKIISVDYSSLEARAFLYLAGSNEQDSDIYEAMASKLFNNEYPRHVVKAAVISLLYGMGDTALGIKLNLDKAKVRKLSRSVRKHFKYDELKSKLETMMNGDSIANCYGRVVVVGDERLLLNTYVQSSAVDIVLNGYLNIIEKIDSKTAVPLFVLHDALIMDVSANFDEESVRVAETIPGFDGHFPVHISAF